MKRAVVDRRSFGARKAAVVRMLRHGYRPEWTQVAVAVSDRERLRIFSEQNGCRSMIEGFHLLLDKANVKVVSSKPTNEGMLFGLVSSLKLKSDEYDREKLIERIHKGEFDEFIMNYGK